MGGLVMGNSIDTPVHVAPVNRPSDGSVRVLGLDGENVSAGGETVAPMPSVTDIDLLPGE